MNWIEAEMRDLNLNDKRLNERCKQLLQRFTSQPSSSIPVACRGWNETLAAYRFFDNKKVTADGILSAHYSAAQARMAQHDTVLCVQDTTQLDYTGQEHLEGVGPLQYENERGLLKHITLAITPDKLCLGVIDSLIWARDPDGLGKATPLRKKKWFEEKESRRWVDGYRRVCEISEQLPNSRCVFIGDRESDIYELFVESQSQDNSADWLVRASQDRGLILGDEHISEALVRAPTKGKVEFELPASHKKRPGQRITQDLKAIRVGLRSPYRVEGKLPEVEVTVLLAQEVKPPKGEKPITWILLTNIEVSDVDQIVEILQWYMCRWQIEIYFRVLKSGCQIEELQLESTERLEPALAVYMIVAWRVLYLTTLGRECPNMACDAVFEKKEWHAIYLVSQRKAPPAEAPPLNDVLGMLAGFGGHLGRKHDGPPGPKSIWIGMQRVRDFVFALEAKNAMEPG